MSRIPDPATEALLDALEPEAKAAWEADLLNITQAIAASQAITDRRATGALEMQAMASSDAAVIQFFSAPVEVQQALPTEIFDRLNPNQVEP
jgi:hypothetical protein